jgi:hypothetical protein
MTNSNQFNNFNHPLFPRQNRGYFKIIQIKNIPMKSLFKQIFVYFLLALISISSIAQTSFFKTYETGHDHYWPNVIEATNNAFIICGIRTLTTGPESRPFVMKVSSHGELIAQKTKITNAENKAAYWVMIADAQKADSIVIIGTESTFDTPENSGRLFIDLLDEDLNISEMASYTFQGVQISGSTACIRPDQNTLILANVLIDGNINEPFVGGLNLLKIRLPADSMASYTFMRPQGSGSLFLRDLNFDVINSRIDLYYLGQHPPKNGKIPNQVNHIIELDTALNYLGWRSHSDHFYPNLNISSIDDTSFLVTTTRSNYQENNVFGIEVKHVANLNDTLGSTFFYSPDTALYAGFGNNTVVLQDGYMVAGMLNLKGSSFPWQTAPIWIQVTRLDNELNILGQYYYGGDASYFVSEAIPTSDGGVMITGLRYSLESTWRSRIFALKVDADGLVVGTDELMEPYYSEAILTPNPGQNMARALIGLQYLHADLYLYDLSGRQVLEAKSLANGNEINMAALESGVYVYRFASSGRTIGSGKWIKSN